MSKLVLDNRQNRCLVVNITKEVHVDFVRAEIGVLGRVDTSEVLVLDEDWAVCWRQRSESERDLKVLTGRGMVEVYGIGLEDVVAADCRGVNIFVCFAGV